MTSQQAQFTRMVGALIEKATELGFDLTFGDAYAQTGHKEDSFHYKRLVFQLYVNRSFLAYP